MPPRRLATPQATADRLAKTLVHSMRTEADHRTQRIVKHATMGTVISVSPLQIQTELHFYDGIILGPKDVLVLSSATLVQDEAVLLVRTVSDQVIAFPVQRGDQLTSPEPGPDGPTGTFDVPSSDPSSYPLITLPSPDGSAGDLVIAKAMSYEGVTETAGENHSPVIDAWQARWGMSGVAWCGIFADAMYQEAGIDDDNCGHPQVYQIWQRGFDQGLISSTPVKGCFCIYGAFDDKAKIYKFEDGHHVDLYISGPVGNAMRVGGNSGDRVKVGPRDMTPAAGSGTDSKGLAWAFVVPTVLRTNSQEATDAPTGTGSGAGSYARQNGKAPAITQKPIDFNATRKSEMAAYSVRHYGAGDNHWELTDPKVIVIHYTAGSTMSSAWNTFAPDTPDPELHELPGTSAHFIVDTDGTIYQVVDLGIRARHTVGLNYTSIGIEHVGTNASGILNNSAMMSKSVALVKWLMKTFGITKSNVIGHNESLSSPYHHDLILPTQTHGDWTTSEMNSYRTNI